MKQLTILTMGSLIVALGLTTGIVETNAGTSIDEKGVECPDDSIQKVVDDADKPTVIIIFGTCTEDVEIAKDDITIQGDSALGVDGIVGEVSLAGARRTRILNMTISGGNNGITAFDGAVLRAEDVTIKYSDGYGVGSFLGAVVVLTNVEINNNSGRGVEVALNGQVDIRQKSSIHDNIGDGVGVFSGSNARIAGVTVQDNGGFGVQVAESRVQIQKRNGIAPSITGNTDTAVFIDKGSNARIEDATISSATERALFIHRGSDGVVRRNAITSGFFETVLVNKGSAAEFSDNTIGNTVSGTALQVANGSSVAFRSDGSGNMLTATGGIALGAAFASHVQQNGAHDTFTGDIDIFGGSVAEFRDAQITGNIDAGQNSWLRLRNQQNSPSAATTTVDGNINISQDSTLSWKTDGALVQVNGSVTCGDDESSVAGIAGKANVTGGFITCSGF